MKPLVSYYGGKQRMASKIIELIPRHTVYVEPFVGGGAVFFGKPLPQVTNSHHYSEVINDISGDLINLYRCFQDQEKAMKLINKIQYLSYSREEHKLSKTIEGDVIERAARYYLNLNQSFANKQGAGWGTSVFGTNLAQTWAGRVARIADYLDRFIGVHIEHDDALNVIKRWDSPQTFFYCDPPYPNTDQGHYKGYTMEDFKNLVNTLDECQGSFLLSNYSQNIEMPKDWEKLEFKTHCSSSREGKAGKGRDKTRAATKEEIGNRERIEVVWKRGPKVQPRAEIIKLYESGKYDCYKGDVKQYVMKEYEVEG